jgi:hypothetical protein
VCLHLNKLLASDLCICNVTERGCTPSPGFNPDVCSSSGQVAILAYCSSIALDPPIASDTMFSVTARHCHCHFVTGVASPSRASSSGEAGTRHACASSQSWKRDRSGSARLRMSPQRLNVRPSAHLSSAQKKARMLVGERAMKRL